MMRENKTRTSGEAKVVYVRKEHAKTVKNRLKDSNFLDDRFRMVSVTPGPDEVAMENEANAFIAIPVHEEFDENKSQKEDMPGDKLESASLTPMIAGFGYHICPYSTKVLGNGGGYHHQISLHSEEGVALSENFTLIQSVILDIASTISQSTIEKSKSSFGLDRGITDRVLQLDSTVCPASRRRQFLEIFGDDRTVVVPPGAFAGDEFLSILRDVHRAHNDECDRGDCKTETKFFDTLHETKSLYNDFWRRLAAAHNSPRVVRRGCIDPNSKIRESGHEVLWPPSTVDRSNNVVGPESPSWICVTEQGVKQSFDLSKVMFSRGNISEKIRFGKKLVQEGDVILDMYAGIGYYTLPAVIHGKASRVYACEWNEHAVNALRYNVKDNKIQDKVDILVGDCRESIERHNIIGLVDRVSLGLLPSSEGGWRAAIRALKVPSGGWLHVHGNVPAPEVESWTRWLCHRLSILSKEEGKPRNWVVLCDHVERVKSFAPTVFHYVADIFVGIPTEASYPSGIDFLRQKTIVSTPSSNDEDIESSDMVWIRRRSEHSWVPVVGDTVVRPSCALSAEGVLSQEWMR